MNDYSGLPIFYLNVAAVRGGLGTKFPSVNTPSDHAAGPRQHLNVAAARQGSHSQFLVQPSDPVETSTLGFWRVAGDLNQRIFEGPLVTPETPGFGAGANWTCEGGPADSPVARGTPRRNSGRNPSSPSLRTRPRHLNTVGNDVV